MSAPLVFFVTEGGAEVGLGHVTRCLAIARAAAAEGARAAFLTTPDPRLAALLDGIAATVLSRHWPTDPAAAIATAGEFAPDAIVVDSYKATADFLAALSRVAGMKPDYFEVRQADTLRPGRPGDRRLVLLAAVRLGRTRLIDNLRVSLN